MMPDMDDHQLDQILRTLTTPPPSKALTGNIMNALPERSSGWAQELAGLFGFDRIAFPAGGALACLMLGLTLGYWPLTSIPDSAQESETLIADVFGGDPWGEAIEGLT